MFTQSRNAKQSLGTRNGRSNRSAKTEDVLQQLREALEYVEEGVAVFGGDGEIVARNARFLQILGISEEAGRTLRTLEDVIGSTAKHAADPQAFATAWRALAEIGAEGTHEEVAFGRPASQTIERGAWPIVSHDGKKLGRVEVYRETANRRLLQSRMSQAEKLALLGQRALGIIHELSNPLTAILGTAQRMLLRNKASEPLQEAQWILEEAERARAILHQLLYLSRDTRPEPLPLSLNEIVQRAVELQRMVLAGGPIHLKLELAEHLPRVEGDAAQLQQVLLNLLQNAQQAIQQSGKGSTIGVRTACGAASRIRMEVWDDGPGIPESLRARIFDPFFTTKPPGLGTGLGLALVRGFVRHHGGTIALHCPPEGGTRFVVELPAADAATPAVKNEQTSYVQNAGGPEPRILVVEDEPTVATLIAEVLREEGMQVDVLRDGRAALDAAQQKFYDLAICDLNMPGMDGRVFYKTLLERQNPLREHVLFVTGDELAQRTHEFLEYHHLPHVAKPFRVEELSQAVHRMLWGGLRAAVS